MQQDKKDQRKSREHVERSDKPNHLDSVPVRSCFSDQCSELGLVKRELDNAGEIAGVKAGAADEGTVDIGLAH